MSSPHGPGRPSQSQGDVAIIGMACVFPKAPDLQTYWQNIVSKVDAIVDPPEGSLLNHYHDPDSTANDRIYCKRGGYLDQLPPFNPLEYGIMPAALDGAEPEHFMALKVAHDALVDAGFPEKPFNRERTEVIIGRGTFVNRGYFTLLQHGFVIEQTIQLLSELHPEHTAEELAALKERLKAGIPPFSPDTAPGLVDSIVAGIIANRLDLKGRNLVVDAACATGLICLEMGIQDLLLGKCDVLLTGCVQISTPHLIHMLFTQLGGLTRQKHLRPFDESADGTMLGEGIGMIVAKRREDAEKDGHRIYAVVKGVGSSSDGRAKGLVAPRVEGEELALRRAYQAAVLEPGTIELLEAHGTGLPVGDAAEIEALRRIFGPRGGNPPRCALGTVKSMIGHLIPASSIAGLIKTALALYHKVLPPTLYCDHPNPELRIENTPFYINTETRPWIHGTPDVPRRAGVNAFGFGGINAHAILEESSTNDGTTAESCYRGWDTELCVLDADSRKGLIDHAEQVLECVSTSPGAALLDVAYTINSGVADRPCRLAIVATSLEDLKKKLVHSLERLKDPERRRIKDKSGIYFFEEPLAKQGKLAFLFPGEGSQYQNMLADLCLQFPEVRSCFDTLDRAFVNHPRDYLPSHFVFPLPERAGASQGSSENKLWQMDYAVDAVLTADRAIFKLFKLMGIHPDVIMGHSSGEIMALEAAGAIELSGDEELMEQILAGNNMIQDFAELDAIPEAPLVAVAIADRTALHDLFSETEGGLFIAMDNCPNQVVICCEKDRLNEAADRLREKGGICQILPFARPYHTPLFEPACKPLKTFFEDLKIVSPKVEMFSCMTAKPMPSDPGQILESAVAQWVHPVRFRDTVEAMYEAGVRLFVEIGPKANLTSFVNDILKRKAHVAVASNVHHRSGLTQLNHALGLLAAHGVSMHLDCLYRHRKPQKLEMERARATDVDDQGKKGAVTLSLELPVLSLGGKGPASFDHNIVPQDEVFRATRLDKGSPPSLSGQSVDLQMSGSSESQILQAYFKTMEQFLETQHEVMQAYLAQTNSVDGRITRSEEHSTTEPLRDVRTRSSGEAGQAIPTSSSVPGDDGAGTVILSREFLEKTLFSLVSERTGYPIDMLRPDHDLEADLGIDSIKRVEILGALQRRLTTHMPEDMDRLAGLKTFRQIMAFLVAGQTETKGDVDSHPVPSGVGDSVDWPLLGEVIYHAPGETLTALRTFDLDEDLFLLDHTLGRRISVSDAELTGLPIMPLTMSMEMLAEAGALLFPDKLFVGMRDVRAYRWITFEERRVTLRIEARCRSAEEVQVQVRGADEDNAGSKVGLPIIEATVLFGDQYSRRPDSAGFILQRRRPSALIPERLYSEGMFMGPSFRGVASVDSVGEDGIEATLRVLPFAGFFKSQSAPRFVTDPVILDAAGQLVAYWSGEHRGTGFNAYPYKVAALDVYGPRLPVSSRATGRAKIELLAENQLRSDIDILGPNGDLLMRLIGWEDRSFELPAGFYTLRFKPQEVMLSVPWPAPTAGLSGIGEIRCRLMKDFPDDLLQAHGMMWLHALAHIALSRRERDIWQKLPGRKKRRTEWLLARVAGKDTIRLFLRDRCGLELCLPDIEIEADGNGRPLVRGEWTKQIEQPPTISLAHTRGIGVAMIGEKARGCGIDVEWLHPRREGIDRIALGPEERSVATAVLPVFDLEWLLRIWCAKEAVGKALGRGLPGGPRDLTLRHLDPKTGILKLQVDGRLAHDLPRLNGKQLQAFTLRDGELIAASAVYAEEY